MDRDTIIDGLRMTMDLCVFDPSTGEEIEPHLLNDISRATYDACKGALEILERLPANTSEIPNSSDTISRTKAIEALDKRFDSIPMEQTSEILMLRKDLRNLPPAQPERKLGKWALQSDDYHEYYECDQCGMAVGLDDVRNFCPNCGADMRGEQDE